MKHMIKLLKDVKEKIEEGKFGINAYTLDDFNDDIDKVIKIAEEHDNKHYQKGKIYKRKEA